MKLTELDFITDVEDDDVHTNPFVDQGFITDMEWVRSGGRMTNNITFRSI